jgi:hypothetical protein
LFKAGNQVPVIPLLDVVGKAAKVAPAQIFATAVNVGVVGVPAFTVIVSVVVDAHCPAVGVKVYVVVTVLFNAGDHVPIIPLLDVVGKAISEAPEQIEGTAVNVGVILEFTVIVTDAVVAVHCPAEGVKVYDLVVVLLNAGDHVPVIPFKEVVGKGDINKPEQIGAIALNKGVTLALMLIVIVAVVAHCPTLGVKI